MKTARRFARSAAFWTCLSATTAFAQGYVPQKGFVPDAKTAAAIARAVLIPIYGETAVRNEEPLKAQRHGENWYVDGTLPCAPGCAGGTASVVLSARDGRILLVTHTQ